jgi:hypothetical protein
VTIVHVGDPARHHRVVGPVAAGRLDGRVRQLADGPFRPLASLVAEPDGSYETIVAVGALCAGADLELEVALVRRLLGPNGRLVFLEHTGRPGGRGLLQRWADPGWSAMPFGCHVDHDIPGALRRAGLIVSDIERFTMPSVVPVLRPWVQGVALVKP